jgi:hypothetical protein
MKTQMKLFLIVVLLIPFLSSCFPDVMIVGNRDFVEETREVLPFKRISSSGSFYIYYEYSDTAEVTVVAESNILPYIETLTVGNELRIRSQFNVNLMPKQTIEVYVKGPYVDQITLSGSGAIVTDTIYSKDLLLRISGSGNIESAFIGRNFVGSISGSGNMHLYSECDNLSIDVSGSGKINLKGSGEYAQYRISGSGRIDGYSFPVEEANVFVSGSGTLFLNVSKELTGTFSGSGNLYYIGNPSMKVSVSGSGRIINDNSR